MKLKTSFLSFCLAICVMAFSQTTENKAATKKDDMILAKFKAKNATYPLIKTSKLSGVMPINNITARADSAMRYKLLFSLTTPTNDPKNKTQDMNRGLAEIGRIINLHIAAGVSPRNLDVVIVSHGKSLFSFLKNEAFRKECKTDNPNLAIIDEMTNAGTTFIACGQALQFLEIEQDNLLPAIKVAIAAKVALSTYQQKGYVLYEISED